MLRELTKEDWRSILRLPGERTPEVLILRGTRNLGTYYDRYRSLFRNVLDIGTPNGILEHVFVADLDNIPIAYASVYGAPMASELVHVFGVLGSSLVVQTGTCGALADEIGPGDIFVAKEAYCGEGASQYYREGKTVEGSSEIWEMRAINDVADIPVHFGRIFTTSALFAEGEKEIEEWHKKGFSAVDMETATTYGVAEYFGLDRISITYAFDNPRRKEHILLEDAEKDKKRTYANLRTTELILDLVRDYAETKS